MSRVWVTGASSGIGAALATELADRGHAVAVSARRPEQLEQVSAGRMLVVPLDVTDRSAVHAGAGVVRRELGGIDTVVACAGTWKQVDVDHWDPDLFRSHLDVHVMGLVHLVDAVLPEMLARRGGTIVGVSSVAGYRGLPKGEAYCSAKAAMSTLLESLRADVSARGVRVVTVSPGFVRTDLTETNDFPMPWMLEPADAARRIADGIAAGKAEVVFPLPMMLTMKAARLVPQRLWAAAVSRATARSGR